jgi:hypothetical protein
MSWLLVFALLLALPATAHKHKWDDKSKETQCELINKELRRAVKHGTLTQRQAERLGKRCYSRKS